MAARPIHIDPVLCLMLRERRITAARARQVLDIQRQQARTLLVKLFDRGLAARHDPDRDHTSITYSLTDAGIVAACDAAQRQTQRAQSTPQLVSVMQPIRALKPRGKGTVMVPAKPSADARLQTTARPVAATSSPTTPRAQAADPAAAQRRPGDPPWQCRPTDLVTGAGFAALGPGRYPDPPRPWARG